MAVLDGVAIPAPMTPVSAARLLVLRNFIVYKSAWKLFLTGFLEPVLYLFSIGIGVGQLIDGFTFHGEQVSYAAFVAPAMLATSVLVLRYSKTSVIACGAVGYAGFMLVFPFIAAHPLVWLATIPAAASAGIILSVPVAYLQDLVSERPGAGGTLLALTQVAGQLTGAAIFGIGTAVSGYTMVAMLGAGMVAGCGLVLWWIDRDKV